MVDYSKWKDIEISDDEDDTHPNIDTPSLFRWRHQARLERMEEFEREKKTFEAKKLQNQKKLNEAREKIKNQKSEQLEKELKKLELEAKTIAKEEDELRKKERKMPWNVDTISKEGFAKTVINKKIVKGQSEMTEQEKEESMKEFVKKNEKLCEQYGMLRKYEDSRKFLLDHHHLVCEDTANYLVIWCINLEMEGKHELMSHVAHQCICLQYILELGKQLDVDPRACIGSFLTKIQDCVPEYREQFEKEIEDFKIRIQNRAKEKVEEAIREQEEEERQARLGPGGLDPVEVMETLPEELKACFESRDVKLLQETIAKMPEQEAIYHMKRCVDSGLWVPEGAVKESADEKTLNDVKDSELTKEGKDSSD